MTLCEVVACSPRESCGGDRRTRKKHLGSYSIDAITQIKVLGTQVREVLDADINAAVDAGYGIFGGAPKGWATLKFTPERARWLAGEHWHPQQRGSTQADGSYALEIP